MKIEVKPERNMFGKLTHQYIASFGKWEEKGKTKEEAKEKLIKAIEWYFEDYEGNIITKIKDAGDRIVTMSRHFDGYSITAIIIKDPTHGTGYTSYGRMTRLEAEKHFNNHVKMYVEDYNKY